MITVRLIVDRQEENRDRLSRYRGRRPRGAGRGAARGDDAGREGRPAQPVLLLRRSRGDRRVVAAEAPRGRGRAGPWRLRVVAVPDRPRRDQPAAAAGRRGSPAGHPGPVRVRRHPRAAHDLPGPDRHGRVVGPRGDRARTGGRGPRGPGGRHPLDLRTDGRHRARPAVGTDRRGGRRGPLSRRRRRRGPGPRLPGRGLRLTGADHRRAQALRRLRGGAGRAGLRRGQPVRLRAVERLLPAVPGRGRGGGGQRDVGVHEPERHPGLRQPVAVLRRAAGASGASTGSWSATPTPCATSSPTASRPTWPTPGRAA